MNIIIVGCGRVGRTLAKALNGDGNEVTVIDQSVERVNTVTSRYDVLGIVGNGATQTVQREAGIDTADLLIAVTGSDELNLLCCMIAQKEGHCQTIARLKNPDYSNEAEYLKQHLGLAMIVNPEYAAAEEIARVLRFPSALKIEPFAKGKVELIKFRLRTDSPLVGMSVKDMVAKYRVDMLVATIERDEKVFIANGMSTFEEKDVVSIIATPKNANEFFKKINSKCQTVKDAIIIGGSTISYYLCEILERADIRLKIIEKEYKICEEFCTRWPKTAVIHGDALDKELLKEEGIERSGAFVTLCNADEENILLSVYAKGLGTGKLITKINRTDYDNVINRLDLETIICPRTLTADQILRYVRATKNAKGSNVERLYNLIQGKVEACEFIIKENSPIAGIPLSELKLKPNVLICAITRGDEVIVPRGHHTIESGDTVILVSSILGLGDVLDVLE